MDSETETELVVPGSAPHEQMTRVMTAFTGLLESKDAADESQDTALGRGTRHIAMVHLDTFGNDNFRAEFDGFSEKRGEAEGLEKASFLTDPGELDGSEFDSGNEGSPLAALSSKEMTIEKSAPKNTKESYDIRDGRAGFFARSRKMASNSSLDLAGPLVYPPEFPEPKSRQSKRAQAESDAADIIKMNQGSHPKSGVHPSTPSDPRGLPGGLNFTRKEAKTYFGGEARAEFFERYKWLQTQRQNAGTAGYEATTMILYPDSFVGSPPLVTELWDSSKETSSESGTKSTRVLARGKAGTVLSPVHVRNDKGAVQGPSTPPRKTSPDHRSSTKNDAIKGTKSTPQGTGIRGSVVGALPVFDESGQHHQKGGNRMRRHSEVAHQKTHSSPTPASADLSSPSADDQDETTPVVVVPKVPENYTLTISRTDPTARHKTASPEVASDFPFAPVRTVPELRVHTKVIIRTQSLLQGEAYEQLKLVERPENANLDDCESVGEKLGNRGRLPSDEVTYFAQALVNEGMASSATVKSAHSAHSTNTVDPHAAEATHKPLRRPSNAHGQSHVHFGPVIAAEQNLQSLQSFSSPPSRARGGVLEEPSPKSALKHQQHKPSPIQTDFHSTSPSEPSPPRKRSPMSRQALRSLSPQAPKAIKGKLYAPTVPRTPVSPDRNATTAPKARGTKQSLYGPSKYNRKMNALLPSLGSLGSGAHGHGHGHGHVRDLNAATGNTAIGDAILAKLNATARDLLIALDKEVEVSQTSTLQPEHAFKALNLTAPIQHHPIQGVSRHTVAELQHAAHVRHADAVLAAAHDMHAILVSAGGSRPHTHSQGSDHGQPKCAGEMGQSHPDQLSIEVSPLSQAPSYASTASGGSATSAAKRQANAHHAPKHPVKGKSNASAASSSTNSPQKAPHSTASTPVSVSHMPNLERGVDVQYMSKEDYLGGKLTKLQGYLKTAPPAVKDKYNLLQQELEAKRAESESPMRMLVTGLQPLKVELTEAELREEQIRQYTFNKSPLDQLEGYDATLKRAEKAQNVTESPRDVNIGRFGYSIESMQGTNKSAAVPPLHLVCVDHRDRHNRRVNHVDGGVATVGIAAGSSDKIAENAAEKVETPVKKTGSLFKYLEGKKDHFDFNGDISSDSEDEALMDVRQVDPTSPVSPLHHLVGALHADPTQDDSSMGSAGDSSVESNGAGSSVGGSSYVTESTRRSGGTSKSGNSKRIKHKRKAKKSNADTEGDISPRSKYIDSCIRKRLNPRASLILRKNFTKRLNLQHHGIGDEMAILFAEAIINIPYIEAINIADNNLTDAGLGPVINAITNMKDLVDLDISYNTIGPVAALSLSTYLAEPTCPLQRLVLRRADVDDGECERFVTSLKTNKFLVELDLCENLIGSAENLNTVMPDLVTGGEALADLLRSDGCVLRSLKLGWNMLRLDGAADLCSSLIINTTLTYLDLSFNSLGSVGGMALGDALQENKVLKTLNVANNSIDSVACLTICAGVLENEALEHVVFDGNPIGEQGAKTLMLLPTMVGSRVRISATSCNIGIRDANCTFDSTALVRKFTQDLSNPFDRAVSLLILYLVASHQTYIIGMSEYYDPETKATTNLGLTEKVVVDYQNKRLMKEQLDQIESLKIVQAAASDELSALALFREIDADGSGQLDEEEFGNLLTCMGLSMSPEQVRECMSEYDVDNGGVIELSEFTLFIRNQAKEAERKLKELTEFPIMCVGAEKEIKRYVPPRTGTLSLTVVDGFTLKDTYRVLSASDRNYINEIARQSGDLLTMTTYGVQSYKMRYHEAMGVADTLLKENSNRVEILSRILPQMASAADARTVVAKLLNNNKIEIQKLRREIGFALKPMLGCMDGHYSLDLSHQLDKFCLNKLLEVGMTIAYRRAKNSRLGYGVLGDCSQKGNWSSFRNEIFNGKPVVITTDFASPMPKNGRLEFDFVSEQRVGKDDFILNDVRFSNMLVRVFQILPDERDYVLKKLHRIRELCDRTLGGDAKTVYECPKERAALIGEAMHTFYENLPKRQEQIDKYRQKEGIKVNMQYDPVTTALTYKNVNQYLTIKSLKPAPPVAATATTPAPGAAGIAGCTASPAVPSAADGRTAKSRRGSAANNVPIDEGEHSDGSLSDDEHSAGSRRTFSPPRAKTPKTVSIATPSVRILESWDEVEALGGPSKHLIEGHQSEAHSEATSRPTTTGSTHATTTATDAFASMMEGGIKLDEYMRRYVCVMASSNIQPQAKAARTLELLVNTFEYHFIMARHLELLCEIFDEFGQVSCSEYFGSYRVELVISLYACVVDLHNFEIVMRRLTPFEAGCVICRLGWLHLYNPMKPEGGYQLDLTRREERLIVKTLAQLATAEPGDNLPFVSFRWERDMASMPGYELTEPWLTEDGLPKKGIWDVVYYAGEGKCKNGCKPMPKLRRSLLQLVFLEEADLMSEQDKEDGKPPLLQGEGFMMANLGIWHSYLAYNEELAKHHKKGAGASDKKKKK